MNGEPRPNPYNNSGCTWSIKWQGQQPVFLVPTPTWRTIELFRFTHHNHSHHFHLLHLTAAAAHSHHLQNVTLTPTSMATPPSSPSPTSPDPDPQPLTIESQKKPQPLPWTHQETTNLIQAYQEKWYSVKKGPLKSSQWEEVSVTIAARCDYEEPSKSATQCRHKMEKLRKRYRAEMQLRRPSSWPFFDLMDRLTLGPLPISAQPMTIVKYQNSPEHMEYKDVNDDEDEEDSDNDRYNNKSRSINYILRTPTIVNRKLNEVAVGRIGDIRMRSERAYVAVAMGVVEEGEEMEGGNRMLSEVAAELRTFTERFVRMENVKMEMMREIERLRMEMEDKRTEMIMDSQRKIADTIGKALGSNKKLKITTTTTTTKHV